MLLVSGKGLLHACISSILRVERDNLTYLTYVVFVLSGNKLNEINIQHYRTFAYHIGTKCLTCNCLVSFLGLNFLDLHHDKKSNQERLQ